MLAAFFVFVRSFLLNISHSRYYTHTQCVVCIFYTARYILRIRRRTQDYVRNGNMVRTWEEEVVSVLVYRCTDIPMYQRTIYIVLCYSLQTQCCVAFYFLRILVSREEWTGTVEHTRRPERFGTSTYYLSKGASCRGSWTISSPCEHSRRTTTGATATCNIVFVSKPSTSHPRQGDKLLSIA